MHRLRGKQPDVSAVSRTRAFNIHWKVKTPGGVLYRSDVRSPRTIVGVEREKPAGAIRQERLDSKCVRTLQMFFKCILIKLPKCLIGALSAFGRLDPADAFDKLIGAVGHVAADAPARVLPSNRVHVVATAKELRENGQLFFSSVPLRDVCLRTGLRGLRPRARLCPSLRAGRASRWLSFFPCRTSGHPRISVERGGLSGQVRADNKNTLALGSAGPTGWADDCRKPIDCTESAVNQCVSQKRTHEAAP